MGAIDETMAQQLYAQEMREMKKLKKQFIKELKCLIETEIVREKTRRHQEEKVEKHKKKMDMINQEKKLLQHIEQQQLQIQTLQQHEASKSQEFMQSKPMSRNASLKNFQSTTSIVTLSQSPDH